MLKLNRRDEKTGRSHRRRRDPASPSGGRRSAPLGRPAETASSDSRPTPWSQARVRDWSVVRDLRVPPLPDRAHCCQPRGDVLGRQAVHSHRIRLVWLRSCDAARVPRRAGDRPSATSEHEEGGLDPLAGARGDRFFVLTSDQRERYPLARLDPSTFRRGIASPLLRTVQTRWRRKGRRFTQCWTGSLSYATRFAPSPIRDRGRARYPGSPLS